MTISAAWHRKQTASPAKIHVISRKIDYMPEWDPTEVKWIKTFMVGSSDPTDPLLPNERKKQISVLNKELKSAMLLSIETNIKQIECGKGFAIHQWTIYHLGYKYRPPGK